MSTPGYFQRVEVVGDIALVHYGIGGGITGVLLVVDAAGHGAEARGRRRGRDRG
jgi:hypothetical protein